MVRPAARRDVVGHLRAAYGVSERRACDAGGFRRSSQRYRSRRDPQTELRIRLRDLAASRVRYGYRRLHVPLRREGDVLVQRRHDKRPARKLMRKLLKKQGFAPAMVTTDRLRSHGAAFAEMGLSARHEQGLPLWCMGRPVGLPRVGCVEGEPSFAEGRPPCRSRPMPTAAIRSRGSGTG